MTYRALLSKLLYALFTAGLCAELLLALAARDALRWGQRGAARLMRSGQKQLEAIPQ